MLDVGLISKGFDLDAWNVYFLTKKSGKEGRKFGQKVTLSIFIHSVLTEPLTQHRNWVAL